MLAVGDQFPEACPFLGLHLSFRVMGCLPWGSVQRRPPQGMHSLRPTASAEDLSLPCPGSAAEENRRSKEGRAQAGAGARPPRAAGRPCHQEAAHGASPLRFRVKAVEQGAF